MDPAALAAGNLLRYFGQVLFVVAAADVGMRLLRPSSPRLQLACWRVVIALCLLLPFTPVRGIERAVAVGPSALQIDAAPHVEMLSAMLARLQATVDAASLLAARALLPWLLIGGALARAAWLGLGIVRLQRLRAGSRVLNELDNVHALRQTLAPHADVRWHPAVTQPVTFGLRRPIVLLPRRIANLSREAQRAIVCHELLHVARRDWAWMLLEELLKSALWWHPAIWWALARVDLCREMIIDHEVVALTEARRPYMRALMSFADAAPAVAPALPFIRRRHLVARLEQLGQEVPMSRLRLASATAALTIIIAGASWIGLSALPLQTHDKPIKAGGDIKPRVITKVNAIYPQDALDARVQGEVLVELRIAKDGTVADTRVVKSVPMLDKATTDAVRKWKFEPVVVKGKPVEALCTIAMQFRLK